MSNYPFSVTRLAKSHGLSVSTIYERLRKGMTIEEALAQGKYRDTGEMVDPGIYALRNLAAEAYYIGATVNLASREACWRHHLKNNFSTNAGREVNRHIREAALAGAVIDFKVLHRLPPTATTQLLHGLEIACITRAIELGKNLYNIRNN